MLSMVKQLGLPTFLMALTCTDLRWDDLISVIATFHGENLALEDMIVWIFSGDASTLT